ncbi:hypothetical protein VTO42DRAFT_8476 [Malbranchea cinnamomea]
MQVWRAPARRLSPSIYRPLWFPRRQFGSTVPLGRSKPKKKSKTVQNPAFNEKAVKRRQERIAISRSDDFPLLVNAALQDLKREYKNRPQNIAELEVFRDALTQAFSGEADDAHLRRLRTTLREKFIEAGPSELYSTLQTEFRNHLFDSQFSKDIALQEKLVDFSSPAEWYPAARAIQRKIHLHVGPTNSGKTYQALKRLEQAETGFYAGPLRLLAHEVYTRLNNKGITCGLITGDEVKIDEENPPRIYSNTVEMVPLGKEFEVGVIDEIQMIADENRGWAWTRALLGSQVHELHLCGEERVVPLIRELTALTGDKLEVHRYKRLNPLKTMTTSLKGNLKRLEKGDCIVAFSRLTIHALKQEIERTTGRRAAIVYGGLPAEIRSQQADLFNDPNNDYDFLVASDAIGMGLNLSCKRIIFESVVRKTPSGLQRLSISQVKQIGGRAGRYRTAAQTGADDSNGQNVGFVTSLEDIDLPYIREALRADPEPIRQAGLIPPDHLIQNFADHFPPDVPFAYVLKRVLDIHKTHPRFFLCSLQDHDVVTTVLDGIQGLRVEDKLCFSKAPVAGRDPETQKVVSAFARCVAQNKSGGLLEIPELRLDVLDAPVSGDKDYLHALEFLHRSLVLYLWLSFRCGGVFTDRTLATHVKELVEIKMDRALTEFSANSKLRKASSLRRQIALLKQMQQQEGAVGVTADEELGNEEEEEDEDEDVRTQMSTMTG